MPAVNAFDVTITHAFNGFAQHSQFFDHAIVLLAVNHLLKGGVLMCMFWYLWFHADKNLDDKRDHMISTLIGAFIAMFIARVVVNILPFRVRPVLNEDLHLTVPYGLDLHKFDHLSSMPSDHATLFFALAGGIVYIFKRWGLLALAYTMLFIALPRIYLGLHYLTDILAGALIGFAVISVTNSRLFTTRVSHDVLKFRNRKPHIFKVFFFIVTFQIAEMFESGRQIASFIIHPSAPMH